MAKMMGNDDNTVRDLLMKAMGFKSMPRKTYKMKRNPAYNVQPQRPVRKAGAKAVPMPSKRKPSPSAGAGPRPAFTRDLPNYVRPMPRKTSGASYKGKPAVKKGPVKKSAAKRMPKKSK